MQRAFETWSQNHQDISFVNVTEICDAEEAVIRCRAQHTTNSTDTNTEDGDLGSGEGETGQFEVGADPRATTNGNCTKLCSAAKVFVLAEHLYAGSNAFPLPAQVGLWAAVNDTAESRIGEGISLQAPRTTSGAYAWNQPRIGAATLTFNRNQCMYLDSTFCKGMHEMKANGMSPLVFFALVCMPIFACAIVGLIVRLGISIQTLRKSEGGCAARSRDALHALTTPIWLTFLLIAMIIIFPYVYFSIAVPCVRCFDFEASFVQAVGGVLGLSDPGAEGAANYEFKQALNSSNCAGEAIATPGTNNLLRRATLEPTAVGDGPVMLSPRRTRAEHCPSLDDLQGLNFLYPTCNNLTRQEDPICIESLQSLGLLRFAGIVIVGVVVSFITVAACSCLTRRTDTASSSTSDGPANAAGAEGVANVATSSKPAPVQAAAATAVKAVKPKPKEDAMYPAATPSTTTSVFAKAPAPAALAEPPAAAPTQLPSFLSDPGPDAMAPDVRIAAAPSPAGRGGLHRI